MKFIDLFAGLGGFHVALAKLGHECVFASEIDNNLRNLYKHNFSLYPHGDISKIDVRDIPKHDILCAGFPCQPFSKAGYQVGLMDTRGTLFNDIVRILKFHKPDYFILENVPHLKNHDHGKTWKIISETLDYELGYNIDDKKLSPHQFGIPQIRERIFIVGSKKGLDNFSWPSPQDNIETDIRTILDKSCDQVKQLPKRERECLDLWQIFLNKIPVEDVLPSFPIWSMEFGATYPFESTAPYHLSKSQLNEYTGSFGRSLYGMPKKTQLERLPSYARVNQKTTSKEFPSWKKRFIRQNREFIKKYHNEWLSVIHKLRQLPPSWQKFEWNCQGEDRDLSRLIIQFRGSGIRVKKPNYSPSLVSSSSTQIPIIGWESRYIKPIEAARLQSLESITLPSTEGAAFKALGNAVNASIVTDIARRLFRPNEISLQCENDNIHKPLKIA